MVMASETRVLLDSVDQRIAALELFAVKHRLNGQRLPSLAPQRKFRSSKGLFNAIESGVMRLDRIAESLPRNVSYGRSHIQAQLVDYDPGEHFLRAISAKTSALVETTEQIGQLGNEFGADASIIGEQGRLLQASINAEATLIGRASRMGKPASQKKLKQECESLVEASSDVSDLKYDIAPKSRLHDHAMAMGDCAAALGWVVNPTSLKHVREYKNIVEALTSNILAKYIELGCNPVHSHFAEALNAVMKVLVEYVEKEHPAGLRWNYAYGATPQGYKRAQRNVRKDSHPVGDFYRLMHGALTVFVLTSRELGEPLLSSSGYILAAYEEMAKAVETASGRSKPQGDPTAMLKMLLISIQNELTSLSNILENVSESDAFYKHCEALTEFAHAMQWSSATMQKMSPVGYVIDIERVTLLYLDKVDQMWETRKDYTGNLHRAWGRSVRDMLTELKEYVKLHHPNELMFDTQRTRKSVDKLMTSVSLTKQIEAMKGKSTAKKWVPFVKTKRTKYGTKRINSWRRAT